MSSQPSVIQQTVSHARSRNVEAKKRFVPYKYLSNADKNRVRTLGFSESSWNNPFVAEDAPAIEFEDFDSILEETPNLAQVIRDLEFTPRAWDCYGR